MKKFTCPVPGCGKEAEYLGFDCEEVVIRKGMTLKQMLEEIPRRPAMVQRNILVRCSVHEKQYVLHIGDHISAIRKPKPKQGVKRRSSI